MTLVASRGHTQLSSTVSCLRSACAPGRGRLQQQEWRGVAGHDDPAHLSQWGDEVPPERQPGGQDRAAVGVVFWLTRDVGQASEVRRGYPRPYLPVRGLISPDQPHVAVPGRCPAQHDLCGGCGGLVGGRTPSTGTSFAGSGAGWTRSAGRSSVRSVTAPGSALARRAPRSRRRGGGPVGGPVDGGDPVAVLVPVRSPRSVNPRIDAGTGASSAPALAAASSGSSRLWPAPCSRRTTWMPSAPGCGRHDMVTENSASVTGNLRHVWREQQRRRAGRCRVDRTAALGEDAVAEVRPGGCVQVGHTARLACA